MLDERYTGTPKTVYEILSVAYGPYGGQSWQVRKFAEEVVKHVRPRDYWSEALAIYYTCCSLTVRYTHDPTLNELVKSPAKMIHEIMTRGVALGDCDDLTALIIAGELAIGVPVRVGTGAFDLDLELLPQLGMERPERFGLTVQGSGRAPGPFTHVWAEGQRPDGTWVMLDPVAGPNTRQMLRQLKQVRYYHV